MAFKIKPQYVETTSAAGDRRLEDIVNFVVLNNERIHVNLNCW